MDSALAEHISSWGKKDRQIKLINRSVIYPLEYKDMMKVLEYCAHVIFLAELHALRRYAGKGVNFAFGEGGLPVPVPSPEEADAISRYDSRTLTRSPNLGRLGTIAATFTTTAAALDSSVVGVLPRDAEWTTVKSGTSRFQIDARFTPVFLDMAGLTDVISRTNKLNVTWISHEIAALVYLLVLSGPLMSVMIRMNLSFTNITQYGYFTIDKAVLKSLAQALDSRVREIAERILPSTWLPANIDELLKVLEGSKGQAWPLIPGPPIRDLGNAVCIDMYTATLQREWLLDYPDTKWLQEYTDDEKIIGGVSNVRGDHFELPVRELIGTSTWKPSKKLTDVQGKKLRLGDRTITNIDAIGSKGDTLLLVSCKSMRFTPEYAAGVFGEVKNRQTTVEEAVADWERKTTFLRENPGGNYAHLADFKRWISVVCTPHPVYVPFGPCTQEIEPGLLAAVSYHELQEWLMKSETIISETD